MIIESGVIVVIVVKLVNILIIVWFVVMLLVRWIEWLIGWMKYEMILIIVMIGCSVIGVLDG